VYVAFTVPGPRWLRTRIAGFSVSLDALKVVLAQETTERSQTHGSCV
jgi:hypothetical protein